MYTQPMIELNNNMKTEDLKNNDVIEYLIYYQPSDNKHYRLNNVKYAGLDVRFNIHAPMRCDERPTKYPSDALLQYTRTYEVR